jgi:lipopolysaccharide export system permease protein
LNLLSRLPDPIRPAIIDRYALRLMTKPMLGCLAVAVVSLLLERALRLLDMLAQSSNRFGAVVELMGNLLPHYVGLALPVAFFVALFIVITRLDDGSEVEALLAGGVSLSRLAAPLAALGIGLMVISLIVFGYLQPYSRYAYRAVLHAAVNAGWDGRLYGGSFVSSGDTVFTTDSATPDGRELTKIFILRKLDGGGEEIVTAGSAQLVVQPTDGEVTLVLQKGVRVGESSNGTFDTISFDTFVMQADTGAASVMGARGGDERELSLSELAIRAWSPEPPIIPRETLRAEFYARLARSAILPFMPLLALPLGLAAKRRRRTAGLLIAGGMLLGFQHTLQLGQGLAEAGRLSPELGVGAPFAIFAGFCVWIFVGSRDRPGDTPVGRFVHRLTDGLETLQDLARLRRRAAT